MHREWIAMCMLLSGSLGAPSIAEAQPRTRGFDNPNRIPNR